MSAEQIGFDEYNAYLAQRSWKGLAYRRFVLYPRLVRHLSGKVLDIGCGIGDMLKFRPETVGVDINSLNVKACRSKGLTAEVMEPDDLPFGDQEFDGALLDNVLEHIADPQPLLAEARRVLKPGGVLICGVPGTKGYASDPDHKVYYDRPGLISLLGGAGFDNKTTFHAPIEWQWLDARMRQYCLYGVFIRSAD